MNVGRSLKMALAKKGMKQSELASKLKHTRQWISRLANSNNASMATIEAVSSALDMKASEFLALGED